MRRETVRLAGVAAVAALVAGGMGFAVAERGEESRATEPGAQGMPSGSGDLPQGAQPFKLDPASFTTNIDNRYWPMKPGTRWTYQEVESGSTYDVVVTVSNVTKKMANGVTARVVRDTVSEGGAVVEDTFDWYAQDAKGNIWYMGEQTAEYEGGKVASRAGSWEAGVQGAMPGVALPANPVDGMSYRQEFMKGNAEDAGEVLSVQEQVESPAGHYTDALLTKDTTPLEPKVVEYKLYAPGVGTVLTLGASGGSSREALLKVTRVDAATAHAVATTPLGKAY